MSKQTVYIILGVCGVIFILGASIFLGLFDGIIERKIKEELPLTFGSDTFKRWKEVEVPVYMKFHIFHLSNDYNKNLSNIKLVEKGPYVFDEKRTKEDIEYFEHSENNETQFLLKYREHKIYTFNKQLSGNLSLNDTVNVINLPFLGILLSRIDPLFDQVLRVEAKKALSDSDIEVNEKSLFTNRTVGELLFDGFNLKLFTKIEEMAKNYSMDIKLNPFSISDGGSNKFEEPWAIYPGIPNMDHFGELAQFDNFYTLKEKGILGSVKRVWPKDKNDTHCNKLKGTDGTMFEPSLSKSQRIYAFEPQLCRSVFFDFVEETSVKDIKTYRYVVPNQYFQSPVKYPENECYCLEDDIKGECGWNGVLEISNCQRLSKGAPVVMSAPYFHHGDQHIRDLINLNVDKKDLTDEKYGTYLDIEPMTGTVLKAKRRLQVNVKLVPDDNFEELKNLAKTVDKKIAIPLLWIEEVGEADDKQANEFKDMVTNKVKLGIGLSVAIIVIGALMLITSIVLIVRHRRSLKVFETNNNNNNNNNNIYNKKY